MRSVAIRLRALGMFTALGARRRRLRALGAEIPWGILAGIHKAQPHRAAHVSKWHNHTTQENAALLIYSQHPPICHPEPVEGSI